MESGQLDLVKFRSSWRHLATPLTEEPLVGPLGRPVGTASLLVCRDTGEALTLLAFWPPGFTVISQDGLLSTEEHARMGPPPPPLRVLMEQHPDAHGWGRKSERGFRLACSNRKPLPLPLFVPGVRWLVVSCQPGLTEPLPEAGVWSTLGFAERNPFPTPERRPNPQDLSFLSLSLGLL